ncbi:MAG: RluA family pseudouridine synthase [Micrococcaceae bacterium]
MTKCKFTINNELVGMRLDSALALLLDINRTQASKLITQNLVTVKFSGKKLKAQKSLVLKQNTEITIAELKQDNKKAETPFVKIPVIFEDHDILIIDKPAEVASHPSVGWEGPDLVTSLAHQGHKISTSGAPERQGIVQRLDVGTSGVMVLAKSERAYSVLKDYFRNREVTKIYHTLVQGMPDPLEGTIDAPIARHPKHDWKFAVMEGGRNAVTHYELLEAFGRATLFEVHLETGRTHQIRVHFAAINHPCVADPLYGSNLKLTNELKLTRQWLHAHKLGFVHPTTGEQVEFISDYPKELAVSLEILRNP